MSGFTCAKKKSRFPPYMWAANPDDDVKRTNNGPEAFHSHYNEQFYTAHPSIYISIYIKFRGLNTPATLRRSEERVVYARQQYAQLKSGEITRISHRFVTFYHFKLLKHRDFYYSKCFNWNVIVLSILSAVWNSKLMFFHLLISFWWKYVLKICYEKYR